MLLLIWYYIVIVNIVNYVFVIFNYYLFNYNYAYNACMEKCGINNRKKLTQIFHHFSSHAFHKISKTQNKAQLIIAYS